MRIRVTFEVNLPTEATLDEAEDWVRFCIGATGSITNTNPLCTYDLDADFRSVRVDES